MYTYREVNGEWFLMKIKLCLVLEDKLKSMILNYHHLVTGYMYVYILIG